MQKVWICGSKGRVGRKMTELLATMDMELLLTDQDDVDITDYNTVMEFANINRPHYIVNASGFTDVKACEENIELAYKVNALGARNLSVAARKGKARLIQLSTDDVFGGDRQTPYTEFDTPVPKTVYGKSKLAGENFIREFCNRHIIIRSSWIFGDGDSYLQSVLDQAKAGTTVYAPLNQTAAPTGALWLAKKTIELMMEAPDGLYHVTGQGSCTRYEFAREIVRLSGCGGKVEPVPESRELEVSMHPSYSVLDNLMLKISGISLLPGWEEMLEEYFR